VLPAAGVADTLRIAVASNFVTTLETLAEPFERQSGHRVVVIPGSTGKLYAQIHNGAPFDLFLAADAARPARLEESGIAVHGSRRTYAIGRLVLWSAVPGIETDGPAILEQRHFRHLAIANPRLAPYGRAAKETLEKLGLWEPLRGRLVRGENIAQAYRYARERIADIGLVALAQIKQDGQDGHWLVPATFHAPIEQQLVALNRRPATTAFLRWLRRDDSRATIREHGYEVP